MTEDILIELDDARLLGSMSIPRGSQSLVIFAHGSGSSRLSPRNRFVADALNAQGLATCLFDLLTEEEERIDDHTLQFRFDIPLLANRLAKVTLWLADKYKQYAFKMGYFGASTGAAAALIASTTTESLIQAVVSRGGRPDLAATDLPKVTAATLLIVGENDPTVIELNQQAYELLNTTKQLAIVPLATHLFEEPGTLEEVIELSQEWFSRYL